MPATLPRLPDQVERSVLYAIQPFGGGPVCLQCLIRPNCLETLDEVARRNDVDSKLTDGFDGSSGDAGDVGGCVSGRVFHRHTFESPEHAPEPLDELFPL